MISLLEKHRDQKELLLRDTSSLHTAGFSPDGTIAFTWLGSTVDLWDTKTGELLSSLDSPYTLGKIMISPNNNFIALITKDRDYENFSSSRMLYVVNRAKQTKILELGIDPTGNGFDPIFNPNSTTLLDMKNMEHTY
ncbi:hypothetical protein H0X06_05260 [Candidatus Dependentiae bacterium]|nr:hypothetical protein [Candidatus Dependentiae bacterium]